MSEREFVPTIRSALTDRESFEQLAEFVSGLESADRAIFAGGLKGLEQVLSLESDSLDMQTMLRTIAPSGLGAAIVCAMFLAIEPLAAVLGAATGGTATAVGGLRDAKRRKKEMVARLRKLRRLVTSDLS